MRPFVYSFLFVLSMNVCPTALAQDNLSEILDSGVLYSWTQQKGPPLDAPVWFGKKINLRRLFSADDKQELIDKWLTLKDVRYKISSSRAMASSHLMGSLRSVQGPSGVPVQVLTIVPHPRLHDQARFNLIKTFSALEPPRLRAEFTETLNIRDRDVQFAKHLKKGPREPIECSLLFKLTQQSRLFLKAPCTHARELKKVARLLTLDRFESKLDS